MEKGKIAKAAGAGIGVLILLALYRDIRIEVNDLRERVAVLETLGGIHE